MHKQPQPQPAVPQHTTGIFSCTAVPVLDSTHMYESSTTVQPYGTGTRTHYCCHTAHSSQHSAAAGHTAAAGCAVSTVCCCAAAAAAAVHAAARRRAAAAAAPRSHPPRPPPVARCGARSRKTHPGAVCASSQAAAGGPEMDFAGRRPRELWIAASQGSVPDVTTCLDAGDNINAKEPNVPPPCVELASCLHSPLPAGMHAVKGNCALLCGAE
jgi:hypothetical protein